MKRKKILLVRVPEIDLQSSKTDIRNVGITSLAVPLGISYVASVIRHKTNYDCQILDLYAEYYEVFTNECISNPSKIITISKNVLNDIITQYQPDIVGFSASFLFQHSLVKELIEFTKDNFPFIAIFLGGYPTVAPGLVMKDIPSLDVLFIGEADISLVQVLESAENKIPLGNIRGIAYRSDDGVVINQGHNLVTNISEIPHPSFDMLPLSKYKDILGRNDFPMMTSRGCPFSCNFCAIRLYSGRTLRLRNLDDLLKEMEVLHNKFNIDFLHIWDDNFIVNKKHSKGFLKALIKHKMTVPWCDLGGFHVNSMDEELLDLCKASGCSQIVFAIESGCDRVLKDIMNKNVDLEHALKMAKYCREIGLPVHCYFILGNPGETEQEIKKTINFAHEMKVDSCSFSIATPFYGTKYYEIAIEKGYFLHNPDNIFGMKYMEADLKIEGLSPQALKDIQYDANIRVNFLENRCLSGDNQILETALGNYTRIFKQYNFHAIALLVQGYLCAKLGKMAESDNKFKQVYELLKNEDISRAYGKYIQWDTPATNLYRRSLAHREGESDKAT